MEVKLKKINISKEWKIHKNEFYDIEPDNEYPLDEVWTYFINDITQMYFKDYTIDLGFNGDYLSDRNGAFNLTVLKGDFLKGVLFERFISRSTNEIESLINLYIKLIESGDINELKGFQFDNSISQYFDLYSAYYGIKTKLNDNDWNKTTRKKQQATRLETNLV